MRKLDRVKLATGGGLSLALLMGTTALAGQAADEGKGAELEEIVVTADRAGFGKDLVQVGSFRGAKVIDTPMTVSVIPQELIKSQQALSILDALRNTAGVTSSQTSNVVYNNISIRGIPVENRGNYRLNGTLPIINLTDVPLEDKDRVEALKGASALYYGFTTPSGIINLTMKRPTQEPFAYLNVFGNQHGTIGGHIEGSGTSGIIGARVNLVYADLNSGVDHTKGERSLIAGAFDIKPNDKLTLSIDAEHYTKTVNEPGLFNVVQPAPSLANLYPAAIVPPVIDNSTNFAPDWAENDSSASNLLLMGRYKFNKAWELTLAGGIARLERDRVLARLTPTNFTTGEGTMTIGLQPDAHYKNRNLRAEIAGAFFTGPFEHEILVGVSRNVRDQYASTSQPATCPGATPTSPRVTCTQNFINPRPIPRTAQPVPTFVGTRIDDTGYYVFDRVKFGSWLQLLGGVRKSDYEEKNLNTDTTTFSDKPTSISYGVVVKPKEWVSVYATFIEGLESTPPAPFTASNASQQLPATDSKQKEAGIKVEPRKGLLLQAAYFDIERGSTYVNSSNVYVQDGEARFKGLEMSLTGEVTEQFSIFASALRLSAKQVSGAPTVVNRNAAGVVTSVSPTLVGNWVDNTAKWTWSVAGEYRFDPWVEGLSVNAGVYYTGKRYVNPLNTGTIPSYTLWDVGAAYATELYDQPVTFRLNVQNVGNKDYFSSTGGNLIALGTPRQIKFSVSTTF